MANFTQDTAVTIPADEVPAWVKAQQVGIYTGVVLVTMVIYDASEFLRRLVFDRL